MDKRIYIIAVLAVLAVVLTLLNRSRDSAFNPPSGNASGSMEVPNSDQVYSMADTTLRLLGIEQKNIRPLKGSNDIRVYYPDKFDEINFMLAMQDSLQEYNAVVTSVENVKENNTIVQIKSGDVIVRSFIFRKEPVQKKGALSSVRNQTKRH